MTFRKKLDCIIQENILGIKTITQLEIYLDLGNSTLMKAYHNDREPSIRTMNKIFEALSVNDQWWKTGKGKVFGQPTLSLSMIVTAQRQTIDAMGRQIDKQEQNSELQKVLNSMLTDEVGRLNAEIARLKAERQLF